MQDHGENVVSKAVELSEAVFSNYEADLGEGYDGEVDSYVAEDLGNSIEIALMDTGGGIPHLGDLPSFSDLGRYSESWADVFYSLTPDASEKELADDTDFHEDYLSKVLCQLEEEGMVKSQNFSSHEGDGSERYFYGENALPYLILFSEAEKIVEEKVEDENQSQASSLRSGKQGENKSLRDIMEDSLNGESSEQVIAEQEEVGGIDARDQTEEDDNSPSVGDDEYYEGW